MSKPMNPVDLAPWYILRAATRQERRACASLDELKIEHYLPCETVERTLCRRVVKIQRALFPGYLFAKIPDRMFKVAIDADGVHAPVRTTTAGGERVPRRVSPQLVAAIRAAQETGEFDRTIVAPAKPLETGDSVRVTVGPFEGLIGAVIEMRGKDRIALLLGGRFVDIELVAVEIAA